MHYYYALLCIIMEYGMIQNLGIKYFEERKQNQRQEFC